MLNIKLSVREIFLISASVLFIGCGDKPQEETKAVSSAPAASSKIEIIENKNAKEIKVQEKQVENKQNEKYYFNYGIKSAYDPNSKPANEDASVREKPRTAVDANLHIRSPYEKVEISMLVKKLSKDFMVKCSACHNDYANGIIGPSLLNKTPDQILKSIADFKTGVKSNPLMDDLIKLMKDEQIKKLADEIYQFNQKIKKLKDK